MVRPTVSSSSAVSLLRHHQQHYESLRVDGGVETPTNILIIDDIVTRGATQIAAAARLSEVYKGATIRGFAIARTDVRVDHSQDPVVGHIFVANGQAYRRP